ncbi:mannose-6-phosphate isomerase, type 3 [Rhizobiales bacterium GAS113]|nr:mannose-6-phosphate isomerase, type 3 [Rhizobiales bacterium GAS113]
MTLKGIALEPGAGLAAELAAVKAWLIDEALPFWSSRGFDRSTGLFEERLDFSGQPVAETPRRLMVQCRQLYVFSHATLLGWFEARELVEQALAALLGTYGNRTAGVPYVFSLTRTGEIADPRQDTYAYAFLLFGLAWTRKLLGPRVDRRLPEAVLEHVKRRLAHRSGRGFVDGLPRPDAHLRQDPQMHLLEAALELEDIFGSDLGARQLADHLFALFRDRLFLAKERALPELHDDFWVPLDARGGVFQPGHHFEWIWLLDRYAACSGERVDDLVAALADRAFAEGIDPDGAAIEAVAIGGGHRIESRRCWGTCEALKAVASNFENGRSSPELAIEQATSCLRALRSLFLTGPYPGGWIDRVDARGNPLLDYVPASTLYHVFLAVAEADRVFGLALSTS